MSSSNFLNDVLSIVTLLLYELGVTESVSLYSPKHHYAQVTCVPGHSPVMPGTRDRNVGGRQLLIIEKNGATKILLRII